MESSSWSWQEGNIDSELAINSIRGDCLINEPTQRLNKAATTLILPFQASSVGCCLSSTMLICMHDLMVWSSSLLMPGPAEYLVADIDSAVG
jgi:hypothetical protein